MLDSRLHYYALLALTFVSFVHGAFRDEIKAMAGDEVQLPCSINREECGDFHSIKWYKENRRVFVYSPFADFAKAEGELSERAQLMIDDNITNAKLRLTDLKTKDEGEYKCEITFLDITKDCPVVQLVKLTTLAEPKFVNISLPDSKDISDSIIGPYSEGQELRVICESGGGKPIPKVAWYNGSSLIPGKSSSFEDPDGTGTGRNEIRIKLSRGDLGSHFTCKAESEAIQGNPMTTTVQVDVNLRPLNTEVIGSETPVQESSLVDLLCRAEGARPAAIITWYNGSKPFAEQPVGQTALQDDNTYETQSRISFVASRYEDGEFITCEANNEVLESYQEEPQRDSVTLNVLYSPDVHIYPSNVTINETSEVTIFCKYNANPKNLTSVRWYRDGHFYKEGNTTAAFEGEEGFSHLALDIENISREASGKYSCVLENEIGAGEAPEPAFLEVYHQAEVSLRMDPSSPITESDERNVTLFCDVISGNPKILYGVKWFMDGELLKELPQCEDEDNMDLCDIDPSKLLLEHVSRHFRGNFSCQGVNEAGWSTLSEEKTLEVYYAPGTAFIQKDHDEVIKGESLSLTCGVSDPGRPIASTYIWKRGGHLVNDVTTYNWTIDPVTLETEANISCVAVNEVGRGVEDYISVQVLAPPTFIQRLPPYTGAMAATENFSISCQVECSPLCDIFWLKDGIPIADDDPRYDITTESLPPNYAKNDFESVKSVLIWNIFNWPEGKLDRETDNANFTCQSTENLVGTPGVSSDTYFRVEYPPEKIQVSKEVVVVEEGASSDKVICRTEAYPEANYVWKFNEEIIATDSNLLFDYGISRDQAGDYVCLAQNRHGSAEISMLIDVQYKPECVIKQSEDDGYILLTCEAVSNPTSVNFQWQKGNDSFEEYEADGLNSRLRVDPVEDNFGTYFCTVNNTIGEGKPCEIDVQGIGLIEMGNSNIIVIIIVIAVALALLLILVVVYILCCRKKKKPEEKYSNREGSEERENDKDNNTSSSVKDVTDSSSVDTVDEGKSLPPSQTRHKWPLRPGVHVHIKGLNGSKTSSAEKMTSSGDSNSDRERPVSEVPSGGEYSDIATKNKNSPDSGQSDDPNAERAFYENLPFHQGMPKKQNEVDNLLNDVGDLLKSAFASSTKAPIFVAPPPPPLAPQNPSPSNVSQSRPSSQLSQNGSSGYGSTRSGRLQNSLFVAPSGIRRCSPQFASLRIPSRISCSQINIREDDFETASAIIDDAIFDLLEAEKEEEEAGVNNNAHLNNVLNLYHLLPPTPHYHPSRRTDSEMYNNCNEINQNQDYEELKNDVDGAKNIDYADADYKDLYDYGPIGYKQASREAAEAKKQKPNFIAGSRARKM